LCFAFGIGVSRKKAAKNSRPLQIAKNKKAVKIPEVLHGFDFNYKKISGGKSSL
jgi:hypothetical protein